MRLAPRRHTLSAPIAAVTLAVLSAACDRDILHQEARPGGPSLARAGSSSVELAPGGISAVNDAGELVGNNFQGAYRSSHQYGYENLTPDQDVRVHDLNAEGTAVGTLRVPTRTGPDSISRAVIWLVGGQMQVLPLPDGAVSSEGLRINDAGVVAGVAHMGGHQIRSLTRAFRWDGERGAQLLPEVADAPGESGGYYDEYVVDINNPGDVLGGVDMGCVNEGTASVCKADYALESAVTWTRFGEIRTLEGDVAADSVTVTALADSGHVGGCFAGHPTVWRVGEGRQTLGEHGCVADLGESGIAVGDHRPPPLGTRGSPHAFRWTPGGGLEDLGSLDGSESRATAVNDAGDVVGWMMPPGGAMRAFLWTPEGGMQTLEPLAGSSASAADWVGDDRMVIGTSMETPGSAPRVTRWYDVVSNAPPVAVLTVPEKRLISGHRYVFSAAGSSDPDGDPLRFLWNMDGVGRTEGTTTWTEFGYAYPAAGRFVVRLEVLDDDGRVDAATAGVEVVQNAPPIASVSGMPATRAEGSPITLTPSVRDANQAVDSTEISQMRYLWEWGDGSTSTGRIGTHAYGDQGTYTARLIVTDAGGLADSVVTRSVVVGNLAPTGQLVAPTTVREGTPFTLKATELRDAAADVAAGLQVAFDCGGGFGAYGAATSTSCPGRRDQGAFTVRMRVRDKDGGASEASREVTATNAAPQVTAQATSPTTFASGGTFSVSGTFTDPGAGDAPWRYRIYWGDGTWTPLMPVAAGATMTGSHAYPGAGTYSVQIAVADKDGATGRSAPITVTVTR